MKVYTQTAIGILEIEETAGCISAIRFVEKMKAGSEPSTLLQEAIKQLDEYFAGKRKTFDLPLKQEGTEFQTKSWNYLLTIPYGKTVSYKQEASAIGSPKACRAVGSANGKNNIAIVVPCHRVTNEGGKLGGYAYGLDIKKQLLTLEQQFV